MHAPANRLKSLALALLSPLLLVGCPDPEQHGSLYENAGAAFAQCNTSEIKHLADKHGMMGAFKFCGSNHFNHYAWSPTGELLFFDLPLTANLMDAGKKHKPLYRLPIEVPVGQTTWINQQRVAFPLGAKEGGTPKVSRVGLFDTFQHTLDIRKVPGLSDLDELNRGLQPSDLYFTAADASGNRTVHHLDLNTGAVKVAFSWLTGPVDSFTFTSETNTVTIGSKGTVTAYQAGTGEVIGQWDNANRGVMHPDGTWMALEHDGESVSVFYQRRWEKQKGRDWAQEKQRVADLEENLPSWYDPTIRLPSFSFVQMETNKRWTVRTFFGTKFTWYPPINPRAKFFGAYILWGFEGKQVNRNVMLGDLSTILYDMQKGHESTSFQVYEPPKATETTTPEKKSESPPKAK